MTETYLYGTLPDSPVALASTIISIDGWTLLLLALPVAGLVGIMARGAVRWARRRRAALRHAISVSPFVTGRP